LTAFRYLDLGDLVRLADRIGPDLVRDLGLLDSCTARPRSTAFGADAYPTIDLKAAALLHSIARNHALIDGNERLAWLGALVLLRVNGFVPGVTHDEAFDLVMDVARGAADVDEIARRLRVRPL
jgi:death-on-curing protein